MSIIIAKALRICWHQKVQLGCMCMQVCTTSIGITAIVAVQVAPWEGSNSSMHTACHTLVQLWELGTLQCIIPRSQHAAQPQRSWLVLAFSHADAVSADHDFAQ